MQHLRGGPTNVANLEIQAFQFFKLLLRDSQESGSAAIEIRRQTLIFLNCGTEYTLIHYSAGCLLVRLKSIRGQQQQRRA